MPLSELLHEYLTATAYRNTRGEEHRANRLPHDAMRHPQHNGHALLAIWLLQVPEAPGSRGWWQYLLILGHMRPAGEPDRLGARLRALPGRLPNVRTTHHLTLYALTPQHVLTVTTAVAALLAHYARGEGVLIVPAKLDLYLNGLSDPQAMAMAAACAEAVAEGGLNPDADTWQAGGPMPWHLFLDTFIDLLHEGMPRE